jgi:hypothetical protein
MPRCPKCSRKLTLPEEDHDCRTLEQRAADLEERARKGPAEVPPTPKPVPEDTWDERRDLA